MAKINCGTTYLIVYTDNMLSARNRDKMEITYGFNEKEAIYNFCQKHRTLGDIASGMYRKMTGQLTVGETVEMINSIVVRITIMEVYSGLDLVFEKEKNNV